MKQPAGSRRRVANGEMRDGLIIRDIRVMGVTDRHPVYRPLPGSPLVLIGYVLLTHKRDRNAALAVSEIENLKIERDTAQTKVQEPTTIAQNLVTGAKAIQAEHQQTLRQLEAIGGLSNIELEAQRGELQSQVDLLKGQRAIAQSW
jgi:hypothetical protein